MHRVDTYGGHVETQILLRLAHFDHYATLFGQSPTARDRSIRALHRLNCNHDLLFDHDRLADAETADFFGSPKAKLDVAPLFWSGRAPAEHASRGDHLRQTQRRWQDLNAVARKLLRDATEQRVILAGLQFC